MRCAQRGRGSSPGLAGCLALAALAAGAVTPAFAARPSGVAPSVQEARLEGMAAVERELTPGQEHVYRVPCEPGQLVHVVVDQQGIDLAVTVSSPNGRELARVDSPSGRYGPEAVWFVAASRGSYRLEVVASHRDGPSGRYAISLREQRPQEPDDARRVAAQSAAADAYRLKREGTIASQQKAIERIEAALALWREAGDRLQELMALDTLAEIRRTLSEDDQALEGHAGALALAEAIGDRRWQMSAGLSVAGDLTNLGRSRESLDHLDRALRLARAMGDRDGEIQALTILGHAQGLLGDKQGELENYQRAVASLETTSDPYVKGLLLNRLGAAFDLRGDRKQALETYQSALPAWRAAENRVGEAQTLSNIGVIYGLLGDAEQAGPYFARSLEIARVLGERFLEGVNLINIGDLLSRTSEPGRQPLEYYRQALRVFRELGEHNGEATALESLGQLHDTLGEARQALEYSQSALAIRRRLEDPANLAVTLHGLGKVHASAGLTEKALALQNEALALSRRLLLSDLEASVLHEIGRVKLQTGDLTGARQSAEAAIGIAERLGAQVPTRDLQTSYRASVHSYYQSRVDILMRLHEKHPREGWDARALEANESGRARRLRETLALGGVDLRAGVDPVLLARERDLREQINRAAERRVESLKGTRTANQAQAVTEEIRRLSGQLQEIQAQIRDTSPRYASLMYPQAASLSALQKQVLDEDTILLEYALGDERSTVWMATPGRLESHRLPPRREVEAAARRVYELLAGQEKRGRDPRRDPAHGKAVAALSQMLLGPVSPLPSGKRLLVVADGALQYIPFAALLEPRRPAPEHGKTPASLGAGHEIVQAASASTLAVLRSQTSGRPIPRKTAAILADPVFDRRDSRVGGSVRVAAASPVQGPAEKRPGHPLVAQRALHDVGALASDGRVPRLPFTRREAEVFSNLLPADQILVALDFRARRDLVISPQLAEHRILHIATHGVFDNDHPELSGLVLSLVDEAGRPIDGFLFLDEIYNLRLPVDLVVLSACQTALGKSIQGEGLVGLTRGFLHAGARAVLASLWRVDDVATARLMEIFYRGLLKEGLRPAAALRAAQTDLSSTKRWASPYYWAGFVLQGDWK
jgi:CHAT domain-containing protein/tetratricopeptide (TPR) repeat protein